MANNLPLTPMKPPGGPWWDQAAWMLFGAVNPYKVMFLGSLNSQANCLH